MLKRYTQEELAEVLKEIFYQHIALDKDIFFQDKVRCSGTSVPRVLYDEKHQLMSDIQFRINDFENRKKESNEEDANLFQQGIDLLQKEYDRISSNDTIEKQKKSYTKTKDVYSTHTYLEVPLNKKLNALYDNFSLQVLFYDNLCNSEELINKLESLTTEEEKIEFVMKQVEITHLSLQSVDHSRCIIAIEGKFNKKFTQVEDSNCVILPAEYSDFSKITLSDCEKIRNNDLKQIIQERIDMDREKLTKLAERDVRGDNYQILKHDRDLYIRYVCPSTQRVYYNALNPSYLERSQYYEENNYDSYILAWYSINNLFMELTEEVLSETSNRC